MTVPTWDLTAVLYAVRPDDGYYSLSEPGVITVLPDGSSRFDLSANGKHRYLVLTAEQRTRTLEAMILLASQPPASGIERFLVGHGWNRRRTSHSDRQGYGELGIRLAPIDAPVRANGRTREVGTRQRASGHPPWRHSPSEEPRRLRNLLGCSRVLGRTVQLAHDPPGHQCGHGMEVHGHGPTARPSPSRRR